MIRTTNPFNQILASSHGVYRFAVPTAFSGPRDTDLLVLLGARIECLHEGERARVLSVEIPHGNADAFGALLALSRYVGDRALSTLEPGHHAGTWRHLRYENFTAPRSAAVGATSTFTQRFLNEIVSDFPKLTGENLAVVVAVDNLSELTAESCRGNSLSIVTMSGARWKQWASLPKEQWRENLTARAIRTLEWVKRKPSSAKEMAPLLVTSLGKLDRFSWASQFDPSRFLMFPTPLLEHSANIVLWSLGGNQVMGVVASPSHWIHQSLDTLRAVWRRSLC